MEQNNTPIENQGLRNWIKENNKTPIEQWIEETSNKETKILRNAYITVVQSVLRYLRLQNEPDPKKYLEKLKDISDELNLYAKSVDEQIIDRNSLIDKLIAENEKLTQTINSNKSLMDGISKLHKEIDADGLLKLQSENNQYKKAIAEQAIDYQKAIDKLDAEIQRLKELG